jgi:hypothetical protein
VIAASLHHLTRFCSTLAKCNSSTDPFPVVPNLERLRRRSTKPRDVLLPTIRRGILPLLVCTGLSTIPCSLFSSSFPPREEVGGGGGINAAYLPLPGPDEPGPLIVRNATFSVVNECCCFGGFWRVFEDSWLEFRLGRGLRQLWSSLGYFCIELCRRRDWSWFVVCRIIFQHLLCIF